jgi:alkylation response protein AidB-like acyl-CoA dehydrogenase
VQFGFTPDQQRFYEDVLAFARKELNDDLVARDRDGNLSRAAWSKCAAFGIQGLPLPTDYGGSGADAITTMLAFEALGAGSKDGGLLFSIAAQMLSVQIPIARFGTEEQKQRFLRPLCAGTCIGAHAMTEPDSGSDAFALRSTATKTTDGYVLNGRKTFITNAPVADLFLVFARTDPAAGIMGVSAFLVERSCEGVSIGAPMEKMGLRTSPMADVILEDCCVSVGDRIGSEGMGYAIFNASMAWERSLILACNLGAMERQLTRCIAYGNERKQFGLPIGKFQAIAHRIVDMKLRLDVARLLSYRAAATLTADENPTMEAAIAKLYVSEAWVQSCLDAIQIHGGYGYATEYEIERELRNAVSGTLYSGTSEIQRNIVAKALGL